MSVRAYKLPAAERAYFRRRGRAWRRRNPEKARAISREAQRKYREKMRTMGYRIRLVRGKWKWMKTTEASKK